MITASVTDCISLARAYADERVAEYVDANEAREIVIEEWRGTIWPRIVQRGDTWYVTAATTGVTSSVSAVGVPTDLHRAKGLTLEWSSTDHEEVPPLGERERVRIEQCTWSRYGPKGYVIRGAAATIFPTPSETVVARWTYLPVPSTVTVTGPESVKKAVALAAAITIRDLQDEPTTGLQRRYEACMMELDREAGAVYDVGPTVFDARPEDVVLMPDYYLPEP